VGIAPVTNLEVPLAAALYRYASKPVSDTLGTVEPGYVQMVVLKTNGLPACLDELEVFPP